ncbi:cucumber peeling cupredoxin-like [Durio zibethinus]|uniref:Cucumber peeling cupredoxin-like n=1 Tax=Durio zibethinus TaxID=66656 RepID=A0A6P5ZFQ0_DURZI|nr:cucumber peeling cupredoxin-like [Durio zibethinus]
MNNHGVGLSLIGLLMVAMTILEGAIAADYTVGDNYGWDVPPNNSSDYYPSWANRYEFKVGDTEVFNWTGNHTAAQVTNQADFDSCNRSDAEIKLDGEAGVRVPFTTEGIHYFICTVGTHCEQGQKVAFNVTADVSSVPKPHPTVFALATLISLLWPSFC